MWELCPLSLTLEPPLLGELLELHGAEGAEVTRDGTIC